MDVPSIAGNGLSVGRLREFVAWPGRRHPPSGYDDGQDSPDPKERDEEEPDEGTLPDEGALHDEGPPPNDDVLEVAGDREEDVALLLDTEA